MERITLAILKAKEAADRQRQEQPPAAVAASLDRRARRVGSDAEPKNRSWRLAGSLLFGLAAVVAFWAVKPDTGATSMSIALSAEAAPVPQLAVVSPVPPLNDQVVAAVEAWRQAWSKRDMTAYLDAYSDAFTPPDGVSREDWIASRYRNVGGRTSIDVQIQRLLVLNPAEGRARVSFLQDYTSGSVRELKRPKTLDLVRGADNRWRIVGEWLGDPPPLAVAGKP